MFNRSLRIYTKVIFDEKTFLLKLKHFKFKTVTKYKDNFYLTVILNR